MKKISFFALAAIMPMVVNAAGTYYNTGYRSAQPQQRYGTSSSYSQSNSGTFSQYQGSASSYKRAGAVTANPNAAYNTRSGYYGAGQSGNYAYGAGQSANRYNSQNANARPGTAAKTSGAPVAKNGFWLDAGIAHEFASWKFDMVSAGSMLHYDNVAWNVLDVRGGYLFDLGKHKGQIDVGMKYGMQWGDSTMVDDDITNGGWEIAAWTLYKDTDGDGAYDTTEDVSELGHALSIGTSNDGSMMNLHAGISIKDFFKVGNLRMTPSVGFRYLKYKLETKKNYGMAVDTSRCFEFNGEIQCDPAIIFQWNDGSEAIIFRDSPDERIEIPSNGSVAPDYVYPGETYYYEQSGVSHSYEVEWAGPYVAMDMEYTINPTNYVNGRIELGMPGYTATGDQPYRFDWAHPKSVEDKAGMFGAFHFGLGANYVTALNDSVSLSFGFTFDRYSVSGADANTYLNSGYYMDEYDNALAQWEALYPVDAEKHMLGQLPNDAGHPEYDATAVAIKQLESECPGWVCKADSEIDSIYKSMGIRVGINAKF